VNNNASTNGGDGDDGYGIALGYSSNNTLANNTANSNCGGDGDCDGDDGYGIYVSSSNDNTLASNTANSNCGGDGGYSKYTGGDGYGIYVSSSNDNKLANNTASSNRGGDGCNQAGGDGYGIRLSSSNDSTLANNTANSNCGGYGDHYGGGDGHGIYMSSSNDNTLASNTANSNCGGYDGGYGNGIYVSSSSNNTLASNTASGNNYGIVLYYPSNDNPIYNNFFNNTKNAYDEGNNQWNITKTSGTNIIGGPSLGGNYWSDYAGVDNDGDGLGDTMLPYNSSGDIWNGGDYHPLVVPICNCTCGDICANETGWWRDGGALNASGAPIQAAVDNATAGETICVGAGSYSENVNVAKRLTLAGEGAGVVTVTAALTSDHVFNVTADYVNISGFTATGVTQYYLAGIYLNGADNCNISENNCSNNWCGIYLFYSSSNTLASNTASSNRGGDSNHDGYDGYGIRLSSSSNNTLLNNTASSNCGGDGGEYGGGGYGIRLSSSSDNTLLNNTASSNCGGDGDDRSGCGCGIYVSYSSDNTLTSNTANSNSHYGIRLITSSDNLIYNNYLSNTANAYDNGVNQWNITKTAGTNIIGGLFLGGNYWGDYTGVDDDDDGLGDTMLPYGTIEFSSDIIGYPLPKAF
jgi:parallel beta-helix repeat protein